ncbi:MAG: hypothetical protein ACI9VS_002565 [Candidatus Binatia bacterium]
MDPDEDDERYEIKQDWDRAASDRLARAFRFGGATFAKILDHVAKNGE